jgi:hypothetical protein
MLEIKEKSSEEVSSSQESITRFLENGHVAIWLMKDFCWCSGFRALGVAMAVPTIALAAYLVYRVRSNSRDVVHNAAVLFWLCANTTWRGFGIYTKHRSNETKLIETGKR